MKILITTTQVPFVRGGAEIHAEGLRDALECEGHEAEIISIPFKWYPPERIVENIMACRLLDLTESCGSKIDRVIGLKFPAYLIPHPNKVLWILHQHRTAYELWDTPMGDLINWPNGLQIRDAIRRADKNLIPEAKAVFANSANVASRLKKFCDIEAPPLYHPPADADKFYCAEAQDYLFYPSRIDELKRQEIIIRALSLTKEKVCVRFAGTPDYAPYLDNLKRLASKLKVAERIKWLGFVSDEEKRDLYARSRGVVFPPVDEDYGYITLEAMLASKPVITLTDSGGPLEFVVDGETGLVADPDPASLAEGLDALWQNPKQGAVWGEAGRERLETLGLSWKNVVESLLA